MMRLMSVVAVSAFTLVQPQPRSWIAHGFFLVKETFSPEQSRSCLFQAAASVEGEVFAFVLRRRPGANLEAFLMSGNTTVAEARDVTLFIDDKDIFSFSASHHRAQSELTTVMGLVEEQPGESRVAERMKEAAANARWFGAASAVFTKRIPASGLADALADFDECNGLQWARGAPELLEAIEVPHKEPTLLWGSNCEVRLLDPWNAAPNSVTLDWPRVSVSIAGAAWTAFALSQKHTAAWSNTVVSWKRHDRDPEVCEISV